MQKGMVVISFSCQNYWKSATRTWRWRLRVVSPVFANHSGNCQRFRTCLTIWFARVKINRVTTRWRTTIICQAANSVSFYMTESCLTCRACDRAGSALRWAWTGGLAQGCGFSPKSWRQKNCCTYLEHFQCSVYPPLLGMSLKTIKTMAFLQPVGVAKAAAVLSKRSWIWQLALAILTC